METHSHSGPLSTRDWKIFLSTLEKESQSTLQAGTSADVQDPDHKSWKKILLYRF